MGERRYIGVESELNFAGCIVLGVVKALAVRLRLWRITKRTVLGSYGIPRLGWMHGLSMWLMSYSTTGSSP